MAKFRNGNLVLTNTQEIIQGGVTVIDSSRAGQFSDLKLESNLTTIIDEFSTDGTLVGDSDTALPTEQAVKTYVDNKISGSIASSVDNALTRYDGTDGLQGSGILIDDSDNISGVESLIFNLGTSVNEFSIDGTLAGDSDLAVPTEKAVKTYVDNKISGSIAASVDNALARYDGTDGIQGSGITVGDGDGLSGISTISASGNITSGSGNDFTRIEATGAVEICDSGGAAFIDFKSAAAEDYDCRIIQNSDGLRFYTGGNGSTVNALTINSAQNIIVTNNLTIQGTNKSAGYLYAGTTDPDNTTRLNYDGYLYATKFYNSVWNDIADFQPLAKGTEYVPGKCYYDTLEGAKICKERCQKSAMGILSDTYGFGVGAEEGSNKAPFAVAGWVLAFVDDVCEPGDVLTNGEHGNLVKMREVEKTLYPERIVAIYKRPETDKFWGPEGHKIDVKGRHWVKVK